MSVAAAVRAAALLGVVVAGTCAADQRDPALDGLFAQLRTAPDAAAAEALEARIWETWLDSGDADVDALVERGVGAMASGHLDLAIDRFSRVVERAPGFAEGWNKRATAYYLRRDFAASVADIERTLALEPRHFGAISGMGLIFLERGDLRAALDAFERVLEIHPRSLAARIHVEQLRGRLRGLSASAARAAPRGRTGA